MKAKNYKVVIKKVKKAGFVLKRQTGSHEIWWSELSKRTCVIPHHKEVKSGTLKKILIQMGISEEEFNKL